MGKPQDLPGGETQLYIGVALNFFTYMLAQVSFFGIGLSALHAFVDIACSGIILYVALLLTSKLSRFQQAFGALCGASAVLNVFAIPMFQLTPIPDEGTASGLAVFTRFLVIVWSLSLGALVIRHTFNVRQFTSVLAAALYFIFIVTVLEALFPQTVDSATQVSASQSTTVFLFRVA